MADAVRRRDPGGALDRDARAPKPDPQSGSLPLALANSARAEGLLQRNRLTTHGDGRVESAVETGLGHRHVAAPGQLDLTGTGHVPVRAIGFLPEVADLTASARAGQLGHQVL